MLCAPRSVSWPELLPESWDQLQSPGSQVGLCTGAEQGKRHGTSEAAQLLQSASGFETLSDPGCSRAGSAPASHAAKGSRPTG